MPVAGETVHVSRPRPPVGGRRSRCGLVVSPAPVRSPDVTAPGRRSVVATSCGRLSRRVWGRRPGRPGGLHPNTQDARSPRGPRSTTAPLSRSPSRGPLASERPACPDRRWGRSTTRFARRSPSRPRLATARAARRRTAAGSVPPRGPLASERPACPDRRWGRSTTRFARRSPSRPRLTTARAARRRRAHPPRTPDVARSRARASEREPIKPTDGGP